MSISNFRKRFLTLLVVLISTLFGFFGALMLSPKTSTRAEDDEPSTDLYWKIEDGELTLSGINSDGFSPYSVYSFGDIDWPAWNSYKSRITSVTIADRILAPENVERWFSSCSNLKVINNISNLDTSNVTNMSYMFDGCKVLTSLDVSKFNTSNVTNMSSMFGGCKVLTSLDVSKFNTSNVTNMSSMFGGCYDLTSLDVSSFDTSNVTDMEYMFGFCRSLTSLDVSTFNTSNVTNMGDLFSGCRSLTSLDVSMFDTSNVTDMNSMFRYCRSLTSLDVSSLDTSSVTDMFCMFGECESLTSLDLSSFNVSSITDTGDSLSDMNFMFYGTDKLDAIKVSESLAQKLSVMNNTSLCESPHATWYDANGNAYTDSQRFDKGGTYITKLHIHRGSNAICEQITVCDICGMECYGIHTLTPVGIQNKTCTTDGKIAHDHCSVCGKDFIEGVEKSADELKIAAGHTLNTIAQTDKGCTTDGKIAHDHCSVCGKDFIDGVEKSADELKIPASHTLTPVRIQNKTCTTDGKIAHDHCSACGKDFVDGVEKSADELKISAGHTWGNNAVRVEPNCTTYGSVTTTCTACGEKDVEVLPKIAHSKVQHEAKAATCTEKGHAAYETCSNCDYTTYTEIAALGHSPTQHEAKAATCTEKGYAAYETCSRCDHTTYSEIDALGHSYGEWTTVKEATEAEEGEQQRVCANDSSHVESRVVSKLAPQPQEPELEPKTDLTWLWILLVILILLIIATVIYLVYSKKKKAVANAADPAESQPTSQQDVAPIVAETAFDQSEAGESVTANDADNTKSD